MRFCQAHQLLRTRRILAETQEAIAKAARPKRRHKKRVFTETQLRIARESLERQESIREAGKAA